MRIGENHQLVRRCGSALLGLEVLADGFAQHSMTEIFLPIKDGSQRWLRSIGRKGLPILVPAILQADLRLHKRRNQHLLRCQHFRNGGGAVALTNQTEDFPDNLCGWRVHDEVCLSSGFLL